MNSVAIGDGVALIGASVFEGCSELTSVYIPNSVLSIGEKAFYDCSNLKSLMLEDGSNRLLIGEGNFAGLKDVHIGRNCGEAFKKISTLNIIILGDSVTTVAAKAFSGCTQLKTLYINGSETSIEADAFTSNAALDTIYCMNPTPCPLNGEAFNTTQYLNINLYVPNGLLATYMAAEGWSNFFNVFEFDPETVGIEDVKADEIAANVKAENGVIVIENCIGTASVYDMSGRKVREESLNGGSTEIQLPQRGVYIVRIGNKAVKVAL